MSLIATFPFFRQSNIKPATPAALSGPTETLLRVAAAANLRAIELALESRFAAMDSAPEVGGE